MENYNKENPAPVDNQAPAQQPVARPVYFDRLPVSAPVPIDRPARTIQLPAIVQPIALTPTVSLEDPDDYYGPSDNYAPSAYGAPPQGGPVYGNYADNRPYPVAPAGGYPGAPMMDLGGEGRVSKKRFRVASILTLIFIVIFLVPMILGFAMKEQAPLEIGDGMYISYAFNGREAIKKMDAVAEKYQKLIAEAETEDEIVALTVKATEELLAAGLDNSANYNAMIIIESLIKGEGEAKEKLESIYKTEVILTFAALLFVVVNFIVALVGLFGGGGKKRKGPRHYWVCWLLTLIVLIVSTVFHIIGMDFFGIMKAPEIKDAFLGAGMARIVLMVISLLGLIFGIVGAKITGKKHADEPAEDFN